MVTGICSTMSKLLVEVRCPNTARTYAPGLSGTLATRLKPEGWNCAPKIAATSGRATPIVATPTNVGAPIGGMAQTCTVSIPVPVAAN
jgi:hypothetical protein